MNEIASQGQLRMSYVRWALAPEFRGEPDAVHELLRFEDPEVALRLMRRWREKHDGALL